MKAYHAHTQLWLRVFVLCTCVANKVGTELSPLPIFHVLTAMPEHASCAWLLKCAAFKLAPFSKFTFSLGFPVNSKHLH